MTLHWWKPEGPLAARDAAGLAEELPRAMGRPELAARHIIGEGFARRDRSPQAREIEGAILQARSPAALAQIFHLPIEELRALNPGLQADDGPLRQAHVLVPDVGLPPLIAAYLAAALLCAPRSPTHLIAAQSLVPAAFLEPTALDTVLARLLMLAAPPPPLSLDWRDLLAVAAHQLVERRRATDATGRAYEFLGIPP
jgi:hypothetical protein